MISHVLYTWPKFEMNSSTRNLTRCFTVPGPWLHWCCWELCFQWCSSQIVWSVKYLRIQFDPLSESAPRTKQEQVYHEPLRLRGGGLPPIKTNFPNPRVICKDLLDDYDRVMKEYKKALGPCGKSTCPMSWNVVEDKCRQVCNVKHVVHEEARDPCPHMPAYCFPEEGEEPYLNTYYQYPDTSGGDSSSNPQCPVVPCDKKSSSETSNTKEPPSRSKQPSVKCTRHTCPYKPDDPTVDDASKRKIKPRKGCGSPFCPHVVKPPPDEVVMPKFTCKRPCPSLDELPPIHWDCPDPLPKGQCTNPNCPLREKLPCGHCPIDETHCGYEGCPWAGDNICPPTCPYSDSKTPKHIECTPSICPLVRPCTYHQRPIISRKDKPCGDRCPYAKGNILKEACANPSCPYRTCADADEEGPKCLNPECPYRLARERMEARKEACAVGVSNNDENTVNEAESKLHVHAELAMSKDSLLTAPSKRRSKNVLKTAQASMSHLLSQLAAEAHEACTTDTCATIPGSRMCKKCAQMETKPPPKKKTKRRKKKKQSGYVYDKGTYYPGVKFGHKGCSCSEGRVPWDMGWRWNIPDQSMNLKPRHGWSPGAIGKTILRAINKERKRLGLPPRPMVRHPFPGTSHRMVGDCYDPEYLGKKGRYKASTEQLVVPKPMLSVKKKDGVVCITMNPLKDAADMEDGDYPYLDCAPIEFKIIRNKPKEKVECLCDEEEATESSELDIEFTPPAGIVRQSPFGKHVCHTETQYDDNDVFKEHPDPDKVQPQKGGKAKKKGGSKKGKK